MELILVIDADGLEDVEVFNKHLLKEGFVPVEGESFVYTASSTTTTFATKAYILEVVKVGLSKTIFTDCKLIFQLDDMPWQAYKYDHAIKNFEEAK